MKTSALLSDADDALEETAEELTTLLRQELTANGWPIEQVMSVSVVYDGKKFDYSFSGDYSESAQSTEFGTEKVRPHPVIRRFFNKTQVFEKVYLRNLEEKLGDLI